VYANDNDIEFPESTLIGKIKAFKLRERRPHIWTTANVSRDKTWDPKLEEDLALARRVLAEGPPLRELKPPPSLGTVHILSLREEAKRYVYARER
jgi:hypothetical protein